MLSRFGDNFYYLNDSLTRLYSNLNLLNDVLVNSRKHKAQHVQVLLSFKLPRQGQMQIFRLIFIMLSYNCFIYFGLLGKKLVVITNSLYNLVVHILNPYPINMCNPDLLWIAKYNLVWFHVIKQKAQNLLLMIQQDL